MEIKFRFWSKRYAKFEHYTFEQIADGKVNLWFLKENTPYQFTGIFDCNNNPIYIGDIVKQSINAWISGHPVHGNDEHFNGYAQGEVVFHRRRGVSIKWPFIWDDDNDELQRISKNYITITSSRSEIIGNILQCSNLLLPPSVIKE